MNIRIFFMMSIVSLFAVLQASSKFSYTHKTEIFVPNVCSGALSEHFEKQALSDFRYLNHSIFFDRETLKNPQRVRDIHCNPKEQVKDAAYKGHLLQAVTEDGVTINATYFDRGSDTLVFVGPGFTNPREVMTPFVPMFENFDVVLIDFRGHGFEHSLLNIRAQILGFDPSLATLGMHEEKDIKAVIDACREKRSYKKVYGIGVCYGAFICLKAAAVYPGLFDKIVLDGCWVSLEKLADKIRQDPLLMVNPQFGGCSDHWLIGKPWVRDWVEFWFLLFSGLCLSSIDIRDYVHALPDTTSVLLFHGKDDLMVTRDEFEDLWNNITCPDKMLVLTSNPHVRNHLRQKEVYAQICNDFFSCKNEEFFNKRARAYVGLSEQHTVHDMLAVGSSGK